ncbi:unnamed protein product [Brugia timori]|uniref:Uncharacterized protein n=1 Tax=Brugia timori TaxID=42155 RepID=A0A0R3R905_9BILA|nr:unnamed protein product [Brugia timori]
MFVKRSGEISIKVILRIKASQFYGPWKGKKKEN